MNLSLSDEQVFLREAARGALSRFKTLEAAREALDGDENALPDLWPTAREAGWPGLLIDEAHGGAGLDAFDAMLVLGECGRVLAGVALLGHLPATAILGDAPNAAEFLPALATGERRVAYLPCCPPDDIDEQLEHRPDERLRRARRCRAPDRRDDAGHVQLTGSFAFVPDAPGADALVGVAMIDGRARGVAILRRLHPACRSSPCAATTRRARSVTSRSKTPRRSSSTPPRRASPAPGISRRR